MFKCVCSGVSKSLSVSDSKARPVDETNSKTICSAVRAVSHSHNDIPAAIVKELAHGDLFVERRAVDMILHPLSVFEGIVSGPSRFQGGKMVAGHRSTYGADGRVGVGWDIVHDVLGIRSHDIVVHPDIVLVVVAHVYARVLLA